MAQSRFFRRRCSYDRITLRLRFHAAGQVLSANNSRRSAAAAVEKPDVVPVSLLLGAVMTSHLYREDRIVYGNGPEHWALMNISVGRSPPRR